MAFKPLQTPLLFSVAGLVATFAAIFLGVSAGLTTPFDRYLILAFRHPGNTGELSGPGWLPEAVRNLTSLGSVPVLIVVVIIAAGYFLAAKRVVAARLSVIGFAGALMILNLLKWGIARPRPDFIVPVGEVFTTSFPSGHATLSAATYLTLAALLSRTTSDRRLGVFFVAVGVALTAMIGVSRVYLGLHYPSDVLAGWCLGSAWALCCGAMMEQVRMQNVP